MIVAGVDIGSRTTKAVVMDERRDLLGRARVRTRRTLAARIGAGLPPRRHHPRVA